MNVRAHRNEARNMIEEWGIRECKLKEALKSAPVAVFYTRARAHTIHESGEGKIV